MYLSLKQVTSTKQDDGIIFDAAFITDTVNHCITEKNKGVCLSRWLVYYSSDTNIKLIVQSYA